MRKIARGILLLDFLLICEKVLEKLNQFVTIVLGWAWIVSQTLIIYKYDFYCIELGFKLVIAIKKFIIKSFFRSCCTRLKNIGWRMMLKTT